MRASGSPRRRPKRHTPGDGYTIIFVKSFRHWRTGAVITAPPGRAFALHIRARKSV